MSVLWFIWVAAITAVSTIAFAQQAAAAPSPPPVAGWTGLYVGGNVGYGWGNAETTLAGSGTAVSGVGLFPLENNFSFAGAHKSTIDGVIGGGQVGYNYQYGARWVLGIEADIQDSTQRGNNTFVDSFAGQICDTVVAGPTCVSTSPLNGTALTGYQAKIDWFGTVRGRLGWLVTNQSLLYVTGGLAYGHVSASGSLNVSASTTAGPSTFGPGTSAFSASKTNVGFAIGGGIEQKFSAWLSPNWTWKVEYLYVDLGSVDTPTSFAAATTLPGFFSPLTGTLTGHTRFTDNIVRIGLNYKLH
jgi:outer membrane immunogenic protein